MKPSPDGSPLPLDLRQAARRFGRRWALRGVTLQVHPGEVVAVTGSNGSGKSTLLRVAATAVTLTAGDGSVFGHDLRRRPGSIRPLVGLLGHAPGLYDDLTVTENLEFAARMLAIGAPGAAIASALSRCGLSPHSGERVRTLSSGWQRRVALARLSMQGPRLLLLDEPYNSFDEEGVAIVNRLIEETRAAGGAALVVTHTLVQVAAVLDRRVSLQRGLVQEEQLPQLPVRELQASQENPRRAAGGGSARELT
ncbi:MAG TPA: heme ABC exporter ATP-binding protein CcmA [Gemmatimonadaceae bacterium]|nr:heme ABC exporter ATP-binding protein CcmA [Gemmatimonadaceae bacterium]